VLSLCPARLWSGGRLILNDEPENRNLLDQREPLLLLSWINSPFLQGR
jgi:hypothetical protein